MQTVQNERRSTLRGFLIGSAVLAVLAVLAAGSAGGYWAGASVHSTRMITAPVDQAKGASLGLQEAGPSARFIDPTTGTDEAAAWARSDCSGAICVIP